MNECSTAGVSEEVFRAESVGGADVTVSPRVVLTRREFHSFRFRCAGSPTRDTHNKNHVLTFLSHRHGDTVCYSRCVRLSRDSQPPQRDTGMTRQPFTPTCDVIEGKTSKKEKVR